MTCLSGISTYNATFCVEVLGFRPWSKQAALLEAIRDHRRVACRSGHGDGKTSCLARAVLWWLAVWPDSIVITTSSSWSLIREQLWREIHAAYFAAHGFFDGAVLTDTRLELGPQHFALGLSTDVAEQITTAFTRSGCWSCSTRRPGCRRMSGRRRRR